jgi:adenosine/AMP kinase
MKARGPCLICLEANDEELRRGAIRNAQARGAGHRFALLVWQAYPINLSSRVRDCFEPYSIYCTTAKPVEAIVAQTAQGRGILNVVAGGSPEGVETVEDKKHRQEFVRKMSYKL